MGCNNISMWINYWFFLSWIWGGNGGFTFDYDSLGYDVISQLSERCEASILVKSPRCTIHISSVINPWYYLTWYCDTELWFWRDIHTMSQWLAINVGIRVFAMLWSPCRPWSKLNSLGPSDAIWRQKTGSTLAQVMACCLTTPSHYLNQCWLIISKV